MGYNLYIGTISVDLPHLFKEVLGTFGMRHSNTHEPHHHYYMRGQEGAAAAHHHHHAAHHKFHAAHHTPTVQEFMIPIAKPVVNPAAVAQMAGQQVTAAVQHHAAAVQHHPAAAAATTAVKHVAAAAHQVAH